MFLYESEGTQIYVVYGQLLHIWPAPIDEDSIPAEQNSHVGVLLSRPHFKKLKRSFKIVGCAFLRTDKSYSRLGCKPS